MVTIGIHIIIMLLAVTSGMWFVMGVDGFLFECSIFLILIGVPAFLVVDIIYLVACAIFKNRVFIVVSLFDPVVMVASVAIWSCVVYYHPFPMAVKAMPNLIEPGVLAVLFCMFYAIRCYYAFRGNACKMDQWKLISFVAIPIVAILSATLFPTLQE